MTEYMSCLYTEEDVKPMSGTKKEILHYLSTFSTSSYGGAKTKFSPEWRGYSPEEKREHSYPYVINQLNKKISSSKADGVCNDIEDGSEDDT